MTCSRQTYHRVCLRLDLHSSSISPRSPTHVAKIPLQGKVRYLQVPRVDRPPHAVSHTQASRLWGSLLEDPGLELLSEREGLQMIKKCSTDRKLPIWSPRADTDFQGDCAICITRRVVARLSDVGGQVRSGKVCSGKMKSTFKTAYSVHKVPWTNDDGGMIIVAFMSIDSSRYCTLFLYHPVHHLSSITIDYAVDKT
jgi:hypothetical protein